MLVDKRWVVKKGVAVDITLSPHFTKDDDTVRMAWVDGEYAGLVEEGYDLEEIKPLPPPNRAQRRGKGRH